MCFRHGLFGELQFRVLISVYTTGGKGARNDDAAPQDLSIQLHGIPHSNLSPTQTFTNADANTEVPPESV